MSLGIMGLSAVFAQAAGAHKKVIQGNYFSGKTTDADPEIQISCIGEIKIESIKNGETVIEYYSDLTETVVSIQADANSLIKVSGDVTEIKLKSYGPPFGSANWNELTLNDDALKSFDCTGCSGLTSLDLSNSVLLESLSIGYCSGLTSLDLSNNTELKSLICDSCSGLTELDLSHNTKLTHLNCNACGSLTALDLSNNTELIRCLCQSMGQEMALASITIPQDSQLTDLTLSGCSNLTSLDLSNSVLLESLTINSCSGLTSLDLSNNTELKSLGCGSCSGLTELDLSHNTKLTSINIFECDNLVSFNCTGCTAILMIQYGATNEDVSTAVAGAITAADAADGTVYTDSAGAYYSTIATAATTKGWTIEQV